MRPLEAGSKESYSVEGAGSDQLLEVFLIGGEIIGNQCHQPSGSNRSGVYMLVGSI